MLSICWLQGTGGGLTGECPWGPPRAAESSWLKGNRPKLRPHTCVRALWPICGWTNNRQTPSSYHHLTALENLSPSCLIERVCGVLILLPGTWEEVRKNREIKGIWEGRLSFRLTESLETSTQLIKLKLPSETMCHSFPKVTPNNDAKMRNAGCTSSLRLAWASLKTKQSTHCLHRVKMSAVCCWQRCYPREEMLDKSRHSRENVASPLKATTLSGCLGAPAFSHLTSHLCWIFPKPYPTPAWSFSNAVFLALSPRRPVTNESLCRAMDWRKALLVDPHEILSCVASSVCSWPIYMPGEVTPLSPMGAGYRDDNSDSLSPHKGPVLPLVLCIHTFSSELRALTT